MSLVAFCLGVGCGWMANHVCAEREVSDYWWALSIICFGTALLLRGLVEA